MLHGVWQSLIPAAVGKSPPATNNAQNVQSGKTEQINKPPHNHTTKSRYMHRSLEITTNLRGIRISSGRVGGLRARVFL